MVGDDDGHHAAFRATRFFGSLDGLRCVSILAVLWHHCLPSGTHAIPLLRRGLHGVDLFFVISGFLITTLLLRERERTGRISLRHFWMRRTLRIFPLYYTMLGVYALFVYLFKRGTPGAAGFIRNLPYHLTYTSNWAPGRGPFTFAWSLAAEEQFYLLWPVAIIILGRSRPASAVAVFLVVQLLCEHIDPGGVGDVAAFVLGVVHRVPVTICGGILVAFLLHSPRGHAVARRLCGGRWTPLAAAVLALLVLGRETFPGAGYAISASLVVLVCSCVVREDHVAARALALAPVAWIGRVSYGMYLMHVLVISAVHRAAGDRLAEGSIALFAVVTLGTWALAAVSFRWYEGIFLHLKKRYAART